MKIKRVTNSIIVLGEHITEAFLFPQIRLTAMIIVLVISFLIGAITIRNSFWSSLCSNVFAGLLTGLVLALLSGTKQIYIAKEEEKYHWLQGLEKCLLEYLPLRSKLMRNEFDTMKRDEFIYDILCIGNYVYEYIGYSRENKAIGFDVIQYCHEEYGIEIPACRMHSQELHDWLCSNVYPEDNRLLWGHFRVFDNDLRQL